MQKTTKQWKRHKTTPTENNNMGKDKRKMENTRGIQEPRCDADKTKVKNKKNRNTHTAKKYEATTIKHKNKKR